MKLFLVSFFLVLFLTSLSEARPRRSFFVPANDGNGCGYASCPAYNASAKINVHLVPHSHDDVGWLKTVDQYYFGSKMEIQRAGVQYILDSVIKELSLDPSKRYIQVETAFFWRWWNEQSDLMKDMTRQLVEEGRLEFVGGGWSMNDEATTHYSGIIDNMALGFKTLEDIFGQCSVPRVAWQIDPFGHSREQARLFAWMGFDGLFFARADYRDKDQRKMNKTLQMIWQGSGKEEGHEDSALFTDMFTGHYSNPDGLCFDVLCTDEPIIDNPELEGNNVDQSMFLLLLNVLGEVDNFEGPSAKHIMFKMGDDFQYQNARQNYKNMDKLIKYANELLAVHGINVFYSTPSCYLKALHDESISQNVTSWPSKTDDFFPYANRKHSYWTGFFTSRPTLKYMERYTNALLQVSKQVEAMFEFQGRRISGNQTDVDILRRAMGTMQHHDAVTGTEKQHVAEDYAQRMIEGTEAALSQVGPALFGLTGLVPPAGSSDFLCPLLNISECHLTELNNQYSMLIYNPLPRAISKILRFPIPSGFDVKIYNSEGELLNVNLVPIPSEILNIPGRKSLAEFDAVFLISDIPALGFTSFYVTMEPSRNPRKPTKTEKSVRNPDNDVLRAYGLDFQMQYYISSKDTNEQPSGAYIFRPEGSEKTSIDFDQVEIIETELVSETRYSSSSVDWASVIVRRNLGDPHFEIEWLAGPLPDLQPGIEVVMTYQGRVEEKNESANESVEFWTDANGRQMVHRIKDDRFSYELTDGDLEPVSSNYYPVTSAIRTNLFNGPPNETLSILNDRSQGGSCLNVNECELMIHRRTFVDDRYGVGEALDEHAFGLPLVARGKHLLFLGSHEEESEWRRSFSQELYMPPFLFFLPTDVSLESWLASTAAKQFGGLNTESLPFNVHILTLERWGAYENNEVLVRFEHLYEEDEHSELSEPATIELTEDFFTTIRISNVREMSLGGNVELKQMKENRLKWSKASKSEDEIPSNLSLPLSITLQPMEIRTFILEISAKQQTEDDVTKYNNDVVLEVIIP